MLKVNIETHFRWWFPMAFRLGAIALILGLIKDRPSAAYRGGIEPAINRFTNWLVRNGIVIKVTSD